MTAGVVAVELRERLVGFVADVVEELPHRRQRQNAELYVRGLVEEGRRKSLQPTLFRLGEPDATYQSVQQFLADSPWDASLVVRACAERVGPQLDVVAWVVDDTGFPKDGRRSPGVKRQYSGTLGKIGNCQIGVSVHAVGRRGTLPLGWRLYLPEDWCADPERRRRAKIPDEIVFQTKPQLAAELVEQAAGWDVPAGPVLADQAYGDDTRFRERLEQARMGYVLSIAPITNVYGPETQFAVPERPPGPGRAPSVPRPDRAHESVAALAQRLPADAFAQRAFRATPDGQIIASRFALVRVWAQHRIRRHHKHPRAEWLIIEWPEHAPEPSDYWLSNLPAATSPEELCRLARLRWTIELDYRQLKGHLGLDHYEGRSWAGWHHHCALVTCAHAFLSEQRLRPSPPRPT